MSDEPIKRTNQPTITFGKPVHVQIMDEAYLEAVRQRHIEVKVAKPNPRLKPGQYRTDI